MKRWHVLERLINENNWTKGVELGVYKGQTFKHVVANCPDCRFYGVDLFDTDYYHSTREGRPPKSFDLNREYESLTLWLHNHPNGKLMRSTTIEAADWFSKGSLDFVFVDADHRYDAVAKDIDTWRPKVRKGGMMIGHDFNKSEFPGVVQAVMERFTYTLDADHTWTARL